MFTALRPILLCSVLVCYGALWLFLDVIAAAPTHRCASVRITNCAARTISAVLGPVTLCADVRIEPRPEHRAFRVDWDYADRVLPTFPSFELDEGLEFPSAQFDPEPRDGTLGSETRTLGLGAREPRLHQILMRELAGGSYDVIVRVFTDARERQQCGYAKAAIIVR